MKKIVVSGGGTGGHLFPAIALGEELLTRNYEVHLITDSRCEKYLGKDLNLISHILNFKINSKNIITRLYFTISVLIVTIESLLILYRLKPEIIIGFGGYPSFPTMLAALLLRLPIIIHEQNCFMGKTNKFFAKFAVKIALSYKETKNIADIYKNKVIVTGNIIRGNIKDIDIKNDFNSSIFKIFIFGGSQGAKVFSTLIPQSIKELMKLKPEVQLQITQQAVLADHLAISEIYSELGVPYQLSEFFHNMGDLYKRQDLVISRSGASTIAELTALGLPAIFIPYPYAADNHQFYNAKTLEDNNEGWCFEQSKITPILLANKILELINNRDALKQVSSNLLKRKNDGGKILADTVEKIIS